MTPERLRRGVRVPPGGEPGGDGDRRLRVGILGATGVVGQRLVDMLRAHPWFRVTALAASDRSQGRPYREACGWRLSKEMPSEVAELVVQPPEPPLPCDFVFSSLPGDVAGPAEESFMAAGIPVISNSSSHRLDEAVPLLIPEVNADHMELLGSPPGPASAAGGSPPEGRGFIVTNPNCSAIVLALPLAPLHARFGIEAVLVTTLQGLSGAGYPGVASLDVVDNVVPFIPGEEEKIERETRKILGRREDGRIAPAGLAVSAQCHRVNVLDGHLVAVRVKLKDPAGPAEVARALAGFRGVPQELGLPTAPARPIVVRGEPDRPQPRLDREAGGGMTVTVGRLAPDPVLDYRFLVLGHNLVRGAAGAALLNAELLVAKGWLP